MKTIIIMLLTISSALAETYTVYNSDGSISTIVTDNRGGAVIYEGNGGITTVTPSYHLPDVSDDYKRKHNEYREAVGLPPIP